MNAKLNLRNKKLGERTPTCYEFIEPIFNTIKLMIN